MPFDKAQIRAANYHVEHEEEEGLFCVDEDWDRIQGLVIQPAPIITPAAGEGYSACCLSVAVVQRVVWQHPEERVYSQKAPRVVLRHVRRVAGTTPGG